MTNFVKYKNRKIYGRGELGYTPISKIAEMVKRGEDIYVQDYKTKTDCTKKVLIQCLLHLSDATSDASGVVALIRGAQ